MTAGASHSFHFHEWGDMTVDVTAAGELGAIYYSSGIEVAEIEVLATTPLDATTRRPACALLALAPAPTWTLTRYSRQARRSMT